MQPQGSIPSPQRHRAPLEELARGDRGGDYSEPFCVSNCVNYVAYVACARIDKSSILAYVRKET